jgi:hypothetical protein
MILFRLFPSCHGLVVRFLDSAGALVIIPVSEHLLILHCDRGEERSILDGAYDLHPIVVLHSILPYALQSSKMLKVMAAYCHHTYTKTYTTDSTEDPHGWQDRLLVWGDYRGP